MAPTEGAKGTPASGRHLRPGARRVKNSPVPVGLFGGGRPVNVRTVSDNGSLMRSILYVILLLLDIYIWLLIAAAILSWLIAFNVVNARNQFVHMVGDFLYRVTEPILRPIRNIMPNLGGIDLSPVIVILLIILIKDIIIRYIYPAVF
jgi:YggT family protein